MFETTLLEKIIDFFSFGILIATLPQGIMFIICAILCIFIASFSYPKHHEKFYFISLPILFVTNPLTFYYTVSPPATDFISYVKSISYYFETGLACLPVYSIFYWLSVLFTHVLGSKTTLTKKKKCILCTLVSIFLWLFSSLWIGMGLFLLYIIDSIIPK